MKQIEEIIFFALAMVQIEDKAGKLSANRSLFVTKSDLQDFSFFPKTCFMGKEGEKKKTTLTPFSHIDGKYVGASIRKVEKEDYTFDSLDLFFENDSLGKFAISFGTNKAVNFEKVARIFPHFNVGDYIEFVAVTDNGYDGVIIKKDGKVLSYAVKGNEYKATLEIPFDFLFPEKQNKNEGTTLAPKYHYTAKMFYFTNTFLPTIINWKKAQKTQVEQFTGNEETDNDKMFNDIQGSVKQELDETETGTERGKKK